MNEDLEQEIAMLEADVHKLLGQKESCKQTHEYILNLPKKVTYPGLIPINEFCYMSGKLIHTNEMLVHLGDDYFSECSAYQVQQILERRIQSI